MPTKILKPSPTAEKESFILRYMATMADDAELDLAKLAATLAGPIRNSDPAALVARAIQIREAAALAIPSRRAELLADADWFSLNALYHHISAGKTDAEKAKDPQLSAIIAAMMQRNQDMEAAWEEDPEREQEKTAAESMLAEIEKTSGSRPELPCPLETALRWSTGPRDSVPWPLLEGAFIDFLSTLAAREVHKRNTIWGHSESTAWVERHAQALAQPDLNAESRTHHKAELVKYQQIVADENAVAAFFQNFTPGIPEPAGIAGEGAGSYGKYWKGQEMDSKNLFFLADDFRTFWTKHGKTYRALDDERVSTLKGLKEQKESAGRASAETRARARWIHFTQNFVEWAGNRGITASVIDSYPKQEGVILEKGHEFLKTLLTAKGNPVLQADLSESLKHIGGSANPDLARKPTTSKSKKKTLQRSSQAKSGVNLTQKDAIDCYQVMMARATIQA